MRLFSPPPAFGRYLRLAAPFALAGTLAAQPAPTPDAAAVPAGATVITQKATAPKMPSAVFLQLPRLQTVAGRSEARLPTSKFTMDRLLPQGASSGRSVTQGDVGFLALDAGRDWSRPLRGSPRDVTFASFLAYGSAGTTFDLAGARIAIQPGAKPGQARVAVLAASGAPVSTFDYTVKIERYVGAALAALPVFTVRLDPAAGVWDLFVFDRLLAEDLPLAPVAGARRFTLQAGREGAWLCGLVLSDENPLFVDANANGIDDAFEAQERGALLAVAAPAADRRQLAFQWKQSQRAAPLTPWALRRPAPDGAAPQ